MISLCFHKRCKFNKKKKIARTYINMYVECIAFEQDDTFRAQALNVNHSRFGVFEQNEKSVYYVLLQLCLARRRVNVRIKIIFWDDKNYQ